MAMSCNKTLVNKSDILLLLSLLNKGELINHCGEEEVNAFDRLLEATKYKGKDQWKYLYKGKLSGYQKWINQVKEEWKKEKEKNYEIN